MYIELFLGYSKTNLVVLLFTMCFVMLQSLVLLSFYWININGQELFFDVLMDLSANTASSINNDNNINAGALTALSMQQHRVDLTFVQIYS